MNHGLDVKLILPSLTHSHSLQLFTCTLNARSWSKGLKHSLQLLITCTLNARSWSKGLKHSLQLEQGFEASLSSATIFSWVWVWVWLETVSQERAGKKKSSYRSRNRWWRQRIWGKFEAIGSASFCWIILPLRYGWKKGHSTSVSLS